MSNPTHRSRIPVVAPAMRPARVVPAAHAKSARVVDVSHLIPAPPSPKSEKEEVVVSPAAASLPGEAVTLDTDDMLEGG